MTSVTSGQTKTAVCVCSASVAPLPLGLCSDGPFECSNGVRVASRKYSSASSSNNLLTETERIILHSSSDHLSPQSLRNLRSKFWPIICSLNLSSGFHRGANASRKISRTFQNSELSLHRLKAKSQEEEFCYINQFRKRKGTANRG